jgi:hypothetical protein
MIERALASFLQADTSLQLIATGGVYPQQAPQGAGYPRVEMTRVDTARGHHMQGPDGLPAARVQVDCWAREYRQAKYLAQAVRRAQGGDPDGPRLDGYRGTMGDFRVAACLCVDERDSFEEPQSGGENGVRGVSLDFQVWYDEQIYPE